MTFQPATNTALVNLNWLHEDGATWQNNLHFTKTGFDQDAMDDLGGAVNTAVNGADVMAHVSDEVSYRGCIVTDLRTEGAASTPYAVIVAGAEANNSEGFGVALCATLRTSLRGRSYRGRFYFAGLTDGQLQDNMWSQNACDDVVALLTAIKNGAAGVGWTMAVLSRYHNHVKLTTAAAQPVTSIEVRSRIAASQRRRNRRP